MNILVVNCGSSTVKYQLFHVKGEEDYQVLAKGIVERIGAPGSRLEHNGNGQVFTQEREVPNHRIAIQWVIEVLTQEETRVLESVDEIEAVGHRVLHGGEKLTGSVLVDDEVLEIIRECIDLGPLHNPANILGIEACRELMPDVPQVATFDTAFHGTMPEHAYIYAIPYEYYEKYRIRRYGFHGTSHQYVSERAAKILDKDPRDLKLITCHMGSGVSFAAVKGGKSIDTSMGLTPLEGLVMGTRSGDLDPAIPLFLMRKEGLSAEEMDEILNKKSGVLGVSGISSDTRDIEAAAPFNHRAQLALDLMIYRAKKYIGSYYAILGGLDGLVFTAGIGENSSYIRKSVCQGLEHLGILIDEERNKVNRKEAFISSDQSRVAVMVIPTNEELIIARNTRALARKRGENDAALHRGSEKKCRKDFP
ncbi:acetate/propionate family kinase [Candidatus Sordicultor fermentans]|uniref:acetate/propionate family kinase n=1 Tax=Candidatus Sordicultor fermentans TaxID=1953203 RepID=UPI00169FE6A4|nr:acetate kinase [Candidatus Atribacteria bacterium]HOQ50466.1 acetate kinase [Candidatus Atribacteria bacterium]HQD32706.1 acetate kinase [Candidatus Atribacteria bacterium]